MTTTPQTPAPSLAERRNHALDILRFTLDFAAHRKLTRVASSLTFTTVLAIVPMLAVVLALFTAFPLFAEFHQALETFLGESLLPPSVSDTIMRYLNQFAAQASGLTAVGGAFLVVTSILLIMTIDEAFNEIWNVARQRPMRQRLLVYWAIISLGPILMGASLWASSVLARESLGYIGDLPEGVGLLLNLVPLLLSVLGFTALFVFVPNCRVLWRDAALGGLGTTAVLAVMKAGFTAYLTRFPSYTVIYGAFATLPIFLLWIYLSWLVVLMGATVASLLPALRLHRWALQRQVGAQAVDALGILRILWQARGALPPGRSPGHLEKHLRVHPDALHDMLGALRELGYAVPVADGDQWVLACDPARADIGPLVDKLLIDRAQAGLRTGTLEALSRTLLGDPPVLDALFAGDATENRDDDAQ
ncbi:YihY family inner membrane protein [Castellaniella sp.]|uniref:YihY family inner membrane protein n=1 Tax=Castellaniella sp. TaxID=1955812 RepID=UPI002B001AD5|nr:YihY family inner membrane protein [Castellaniella sp.]